METLRCLCEGCARQGRTCCQQTDIYITVEDVRRIRERIGLSDFYEFRRATNPAYEDQADDPLWAACVFRPDGSRRVLKRDGTGNCCFLSRTGCVLEMGARPLVCRLHPHRYDAERIYPDIAPECPVHLLRPDQSLEQTIASFGSAKARLWHRMLYNEIRKERAG
jgi:Fe-S-cluster containining protein